jgi:hypothetical protein
MDRVFNGIPFVFIYLDDILIFSRDRSAHIAHLCRVLELLDQHGLVINPAKCVFAASSVEFLGHQVSPAGLVPLRRHMDALQDVPQLQKFLGLINFYHCFIPGVAGILRPLTDALRGKPKKLLWSEELDAAF